MAEGEIVIEGDTVYWIEDDAKGGVIRVKGEYWKMPKIS